jgi:hypothetical protein
LNCCDLRHLQAFDGKLDVMRRNGVVRVKGLVAALTCAGLLAGCGVDAASKATTTTRPPTSTHAMYAICATRFGGAAIHESNTWVTLADCNRATTKTTYAICQGTPNRSADTDPLCTDSGGAWTPLQLPASITSQWLCSFDGYFWNPNGPASYIGPCLAYRTPAPTTSTTQPYVAPTLAPCPVSLIDESYQAAITAWGNNLGYYPSQAQAQAFASKECTEAGYSPSDVSSVEYIP